MWLKAMKSDEKESLQSLFEINYILKSRTSIWLCIWASRREKLIVSWDIEDGYYLYKKPILKQ